jgi:hypothetical protein
MSAQRDPLDIDIDESFPRREWRIQRIGWGVWLFIIVAALSGLTGSGPLSRAQAHSNADDLNVEYDRFARKGHQTQMTFHAKGSSQGQPIRLHMSQSLLDQFRILRIDPEPTASETITDGIAYSFANGDSQIAKIVFHIEYDGMGPQSGFVGRSADDRIAVRQFIYP